LNKIILNRTAIVSKSKTLTILRCPVKLEYFIFLTFRPQLIRDPLWFIF